MTAFYLSPLSTYPGTKARVADLVWDRLGDVTQYVEPFGGSAAILFGRPGDRDGYRETLNDASGLLVNLYRALRDCPHEIARRMDYPGTTLDLEAAHLACHSAAADLPSRLRSDPDWSDPRVAGLFLYGMTWAVHGRAFLDRRNPPGRPQTVARGAAAGWREERFGSLPDYYAVVAARLRRAVIRCGDWLDVLTPASLRGGATHAAETVGVFLDPPYGTDRGENLYHVDSMSVAGDVLAWCKDNGAALNTRICLAGYAGEHDELTDLGWSVVAWKSSHGGESRARERLWFSPGCIVPDGGSLFDVEPFALSSAVPEADR